MKDDRFGSRTIPAGWFQIAWTDSMELGQVRQLRNFGEDLVLYRAEDGEFHLMDAYCPHLGAHLGHGGVIEGACIRCPFHGWLFDSEGRNVEIPYSDRVNRSRSLRTWEVVDLGGIVVAWFHPSGVPPQWDPPQIPDLGTAHHYTPFPDCTRTWAGVEMIAEWVPENTIDFAHLKYIHKIPIVPGGVEFGGEGQVFTASIQLEMKKFGDPTRGTVDRVETEMTTSECFGLGLVVSRFGVDFVHIQAQTPVDQGVTDLHTTVLVPKREGVDSLSGSMLRRIDMEFAQVEADLPVWRHRRVEEPPALTAEEARPYSAFHRWAKQFYVDSPG